MQEYHQNQTRKFVLSYLGPKFQTVGKGKQPMTKVKTRWTIQLVILLHFILENYNPQESQSVPYDQISLGSIS